MRFVMLAIVSGVLSLPEAWSQGQNPPTIVIATPTNGSILPMAPVTVRVSVDAFPQQAGYVAVLANGTEIGSRLEPPYEWIWTPPAVGRYVLTAQGYNLVVDGRQSEHVYVQIGSPTAARCIRGPFLQSMSSTSVVVRWRTDWFESTRVRFGTSLSTLDQGILRSDQVTEHSVMLTGLTADTLYYYSIGTETTDLAGPGPMYSFRTAPTVAKATRIWAIGDSGTADAAAMAVREAYLRFTGTNRTDVWLMLGDNAYECGTDSEYQRAVFDFYQALLPRVPVWPTIGNHDACFFGATAPSTMAEIFDLPVQGECGGLASGTEKYYSFDHGNIHFVCLDSQTSNRSSEGPMAAWLEQDLAATDKDWIIAFWHHPPYSWGTHDSDFEGELVQMRQGIVPILEHYGVDLVLSGHSHNYERSYLLNGHYGHSSTLQRGMVLDGGMGSPTFGQPYRKPAGGMGANQGAVYVVCGCSGRGGEFDFPKHPAMALHRSGFGSMVIDVNGLRLEGKFLTDDTDAVDVFVIEKGVPPPGLRPRLAIDRQGLDVDISWPTSLKTFTLEGRPSGGPAPWSPVAGPLMTIGRQNHVQVPSQESNQVFRLRSVP